MNETNGSEGKTEKSEEGYFKELWKDIRKESKRVMFIVEVGALIGLLFYVSETKRTNDLTQQALNTSKDQFTKSQDLSKAQFRMDQRPYLWLANDTKDIPNMAFQTLNFVSAKGEKLHQIAITMHFTNFGKSPAILIRHYHGMKLGDMNEDFTIIPQWVEDSRVLPPGKVDTFSAQSDFLTDTQLSDYTKLPARSGIRVFATWQYADSSGHKYETEICMGRLNLGSWAYCKDHDEIKDCAEKACEP